MRLLPTTLALAGFALALPASASADGRMCMVVSEMSVVDGWASFFDLDAPASVDPTLELVAAGDDVPAEREGVLWCQSADDPRCSPVHNDSRGTPELGDMPLRSAGPGDDYVADSSATDATFSANRTHPRAGVSRRIDRPPRT